MVDASLGILPTDIFMLRLRTEKDLGRCVYDTSAPVVQMVMN